MPGEPDRKPARKSGDFLFCEADSESLSAEFEPGLCPVLARDIQEQREKYLAAVGEWNALTDEQKASNRALSQVRIFVENAIGGIKRYNILVHRFRNLKANFEDDVIAFFFCSILTFLELINLCSSHL